jgi:2-polyprenyl-6-methoxyphenol hydroxylase-like FAD-dependent oxidoreductase
VTRTALVSGASIAGPVVAYWLARAGWAVTVVERTPAVRGGLGGHAVGLFGAAVDVVERMGLLPAVEAARTRTETIRFVRPGRRPVDVAVADVVQALAGVRNIEVMRGELAELLNGAAGEHVEQLFGDSITTLHDDGAGVDVTFRHAPARRFDLVIGADGLHSGVRALTFGPEASYSHWLGGYLAACTLPGTDQVPGRMLNWLAAGSMVGSYPIRQTGEARALFLFRRDTELAYDHRDSTDQLRVLKAAFADATGEVRELIAAADGARDFYLDAITQIRLDTWTRGRVTLVGDAGYAPGPAVGGGTTIATVGAYVLAHFLTTVSDLPQALRAYETEMRPHVLRSRALAPTAMKTLVPRTRVQAALLPTLARVVVAAPAGVRRRVLGGGASPMRVLGDMRLPSGVGTGVR